MEYLRNLFTRHQGRRRRWPAILLAAGVAAAVALLLALRTPAPLAGTSQSGTPSNNVTQAAPSSSAKTTLESTPATVDQKASEPAPGQPRTKDFRALAEAAAVVVYTWDTRKATYSQTYAQLRAWWHVLPDNSNPLTVFASQFEATGTNAAAYASLSGAQGYRTSTSTSTSCDGELAQYVQHPPPWVGLHVCTVTLAVVEHATSGTNKYSAPVSVMVNCPPAPTAPSDSCVMVAFYASPDRIVY